MALFAYRARDAEGGLIEAEMDAVSPEAVAGLLLEDGVTPVQIVSAKERREPILGLALGALTERVQAEDLIFFCRHMHRLAKAGIPIIRAITGLAESARNRAFGRVLGEVGDSLRGGRELSDALQRHPRVFSNLFVSVVQVGENTGRLDDAFQQIGNYLELDRETRKRVKTATRYPILVVLAISAAMVLINLFVIPSFVKTFADLGAELPWATRVLIAVSNFTVGHWHHVLAAAFALAVGIRLYVRTPAGRLRWHRLKLQIPIVGSIIRQGTLARYARSFAMTYTAGVPMLKTLHVVARAVDNDYVAERIRTVQASIEHGEGLARAAAGSGLFDPLMLQMMAVGEESGSLGEMHLEIAESYESEVDYELRRLSDSLEPLLIVGIGGVVLILALGVYLPMWDLATAMKPG
jgi:MSHA biogenesis protein MshG